MRRIFASFLLLITTIGHNMMTDCLFYSLLPICEGGEMVTCCKVMFGSIL